MVPPPVKGQPTAFRSQSEFSCCHNTLGHFAKNTFSPFEADELGPLANKSLLLLPRSFPFSGKHSSPLQSLPLQWQLLFCLCLGPAGPETCTTTAQSWATCFFLMLMLCFSESPLQMEISVFPCSAKITGFWFHHHCQTINH